MRNLSFTMRGSLLLLIVMSAVGCGSDDGTATVSGQVTLKGQPLPNATVQFRPISSDGTSSFGVTDEEGNYALRRAVKMPGAVPGEYVVSIRTADGLFSDGTDNAETVERVPAKYNAKSALRRTVEPGRNTFDFEL